MRYRFLLSLFAAGIAGIALFPQATKAATPEEIQQMCDSGRLREGSQFYQRDVTCETAAQLAKAIEPYARLAQYAYCSDLKKTRKKLAEQRAASTEDKATDESDDGKNIELRYREKRLDDAKDSAPHECKKNDLDLPRPWTWLFNSNKLLDERELESGLEFHVVQNAERKRIAVIFRGTDFTSGGDWWANLHWVTRFFPGEDQYDIVERLTGKIFAEVENKAPHAKDWQWIAIGHSLGGGLATHLAYANCRVARAVVFDSSPVFATEIIPEKCHHCSPHILRIYERGEALAYARWVARVFVPNSENIKEFALNTINNFNPIINHSMKKFRLGLNELSEKASAPFDIEDKWGWPANANCRDQCATGGCARRP